ncbi:MAG: ERF family protein, partial [Candidatus Puniceispirillaceae bacterium]
QLLIEALVNFHKTVPAINKTANAQYGKFADLETVLSTVTPHLIKNGLVITQLFEPSEGVDPILVTKLLHTSGAELTSRLPMVVGKGRNPLHDFGGSCTYLKRYALLALLGLTADMDVDGDFADEKPAAKLEIQQAPKIEGVADDDQPLTTEQRDMLLGLIAEMKPGKKEDFCKSFRFAFKLGDDAKVAPAITSHKHQAWIQENA